MLHNVDKKMILNKFKFTQGIYFDLDENTTVLKYLFKLCDVHRANKLWGYAQVPQLKLSHIFSLSFSLMGVTGQENVPTSV